MVGENKGLGVLTHSWPSSNFTYTWGGSTDLWGTTWTAAQINATNFGLALIARHYAAQAPTKEGSGVDWMTVKVFYKVGTELHSQTVTTNGTVSTAPVIYVYGPVPSTGIEIKNLTTGYTFKSETKPTAGQFLALDFAKTSAILSTGADKYGDVVFDPNSWWRLVPGTNELLLPASAKVELAWRDAWM